MFKANWIDGREDLSQPFAIRMEVFCDEQGYAREIECDEYDQLAQHILIVENGELVATGRLLETDGVYKLGRIAVRKPFRGQGFGDMVVRLMLDKALSMGAQKFYISSQMYIKEFYKKFGFHEEGEPYMLEGDTREHIDLYATADEVIFPSECGGHG